MIGGIGKLRTPGLFFPMEVRAEVEINDARRAAVTRAKPCRH
jgi:hypothetical protein